MDPLTEDRDEGEEKKFNTASSAALTLHCVRASEDAGIEICQTL